MPPWRERKTGFELGNRTHVATVNQHACICGRINDSHNRGFAPLYNFTFSVVLDATAHRRPSKGKRK